MNNSNTSSYVLINFVELTYIFEENSE
ncbi:unnamed protein product, partial [Rotaria magnacalcarata]